MSEKCICHLNGYRIKDSIARKAIEDLQKAFAGLEIADGLDLEEIQQLIQNEVAKLDTTGLTESEVKALIESSWETYEEPLINQKIEETIASSEGLTESEVQEMINTTATAVDTQLTAKMNSKISEAVTSAETVMDEKIETALAGFEGGGGIEVIEITSLTNHELTAEQMTEINTNYKKYMLLYDNKIYVPFMYTSSSELTSFLSIYSNGGNLTIDKLVLRPSNLTVTRSEYSISTPTSSKIGFVKAQSVTTADVMPCKINSSTGQLYVAVPLPSADNAGKVLAVKSDGTGYELIDL